MDIKDASNDDIVVRFLQRFKAMAKQAEQRKGQLVSNHPPAEQVISAFMMKLLALQYNPRSEENTMSTSQIPSPYIPCTLPASELQPIMLSEMRLETHHRSKKVILRVRTPPDRINAVMGVVQDEEGTAVLLQLYYQPDEFILPAKEIIQVDRVCIIKEPFFKCAVDGTYSVRVDHLSDVIWLEDNDERVPRKWRKRVLTLSDSSSSIRIRGNDAVKNEQWAVAQRLYSLAITAAQTLEEQQLAYLNRSLVHLKLGQPEKALSDAGKGTDYPCEKRLFREARAAYDLGFFSLCLPQLQKLVELYPENKTAKLEADRAKERRKEELTGQYNFCRMYDQAKKTPPHIDCATYSGPVEIRQSPGRGQGLFTTRSVSAGELLLCEKAFGYSYCGDDDSIKRTTILMNLSTNRITVGGHVNLLNHIIQKLNHNPAFLQEFTKLHHGDYPAPTVLESDGYPVIDSFLVERIISLNCFGAPRTSREILAEEESMLSHSTRAAAGFATVGIWLLASRINHSCIGNCHRSFIGDMQIVRAAKDLDQGAELEFPYYPPFFLESYEDTQKHLKTWGFICGCELCATRKATPQKALQKRKALFGDLKKCMKGLGKTNIPKAHNLLRQIEATYSGRDGHTIRLELWDPYFVLAAELKAACKPFDAAKMIIKGLEAIGYRITAYPPFGDAKSPPQFKIHTWGLVNAATPLALMDLFLAFQLIAPELCAATRYYVEVAHSIMVGESQTALEMYPQLGQ